MKKTKTPEELAQDLDSFPVTELDDRALESAFGGVSQQTGNTNCGCGAGETPPSGDNNLNCGCTTPTLPKQAGSAA